MLRVGRHSGAESVTLNDVRSIKIMKGKGERSEWMSEAKTFWLAATDRNDQRGLRPFGWILVEMTRDGQEPTIWSKADEVSATALSDMSAWLDAVKRRRKELRERLEALTAAEAQRAEQEAERQMEESRRKAEREALLEAMTPLEREIDVICQKEKNGNPGAVLLNQLEAGRWDASDGQRIVAEKIKALWETEKKWNPGFSGKNKQKVKQRDRCLKVLEYLQGRD